MIVKQQQNLVKISSPILSSFDRHHRCDTINRSPWPTGHSRCCSNSNNDFFKFYS